MTMRTDFDRTLTAWLADERPDSAPAGLIDDVLDRVADTNRRPGWLISDRWTWRSSAVRLASVSRTAAVLAVVVLILAALIAVLALVGSPRPAPPFGLAGNGALAIANPAAILIVDADGRNQRVLVDAKDGVESLTWSPDGTKLAYRTLSPITGQPTVMVVMADGSRQVDVAPEIGVGGNEESISWSPDGARLVIPSPDPRGGRLIVANADGSGARALGLDGDRRKVVAAAWSSSGDWIAFVATITGTTDLGVHLIRPDGSGERVIAAAGGDAQVGAPTWAPNPELDQLAFVHADGGIALHNVSTDHQDRLSGSGRWPSWSPDGTQVAWWSDGILVGRVDALTAGISPRRLSTLPEPCPDRTRSATTTPCGPPSWSPDGTRIYATDISTRAVIALSVDGSQPPMTIRLPPGTELNPVGSASWQRVGRFWP